LSRLVPKKVFVDLSGLECLKKPGGSGKDSPGPAYQKPPPKPPQPQPQLQKQFPIKGIRPVKNVPHLPDTAETQLSPKVPEQPKTAPA
jgi:hypothetical protein